MKVKNDRRSRFSNLSSWKEEAWKKSGLQQDSNPWPPRYRCDALPTELCGFIAQLVEHRTGIAEVTGSNPVEALIFFSRFSNLSSWKEEAWKKSGLQRDSNPWPSQYRCNALPTDLWSHTLGARSISWVHISRLQHFTPHGRYELN